MTAKQSLVAARSAGALFRCRLRVPRLRPCLRTDGRGERPMPLASGTSRSDVKGAQRPCRNQNRALMRGGRT